MKVEGEEAKSYDAVRLDSYRAINHGVLTFADTDNGLVKWKDKTGEDRELTLGPHNITIVVRNRYSRSSD